MPELVTEAQIRAAASRLVGVALHTPLVPMGPLLIKAESLQPTGAFKLRGAYNAISSLGQAERERGVVAHSSGNHALAVAYAAALLGVPATVVVPTNAPKIKVEAAQDRGARIVYCEPSLDARMATTEQLVAEHGLSLIHPFDDPAVIAGQGTLGLELATDYPAVDLVLCPVSGGGLISGVAAAVAAINPEAKVVGVEPELAADARDSLRAGKRVAWSSVDTQRTIADALRAEQVGELAFAHLQRYVHDIVTVSDDDIRATIRALASAARLVAEPGGAVAVAAALFRASDLPPARHPVAILSGGNIDPAQLASYLAPA